MTRANQIQTLMKCTFFFKCYTFIIFFLADGHISQAEFVIQWQKMKNS